jgi:hypothetical protein
MARPVVDGGACRLSRLQQFFRVHSHMQAPAGHGLRGKHVASPNPLAIIEVHEGGGRPADFAPTRPSNHHPSNHRPSNTTRGIPP